MLHSRATTLTACLCVGTSLAYALNHYLTGMAVFVVVDVKFQKGMCCTVSPVMAIVCVCGED